MRIRAAVPCACLLVLLALSMAPAEAQVLAPNLIYTSVQPCRVFNTRNATNGTNGRLIHGVAQTFNVVGGNVIATTFTGQGGHDGGCSIPGFDGDSHPQVQAVVFNFVAVGSAGGGDIVGWPSDQSQPTASILNYANSANLGFLNIANGLVVPVRQDAQGADITLKAQVADTDVLADVVGYFSSVSAVQGAGKQNLFLGTRAGSPATSTGGLNTAMGVLSFANNTAGAGNAGFGNSALFGNTSGSSNTAVGSSALFGNTTGNDNTAVGREALWVSLSPSGNTAVGSTALRSETSGNSNTAVGATALGAATTGSNNVAIGYGALPNVSIGANNIAVGVGAGTFVAAGNDNIDVGASPPGDESGTIRIGTTGVQTSTFIAGIDGATSSSGTAVLINASGQLGTTTSSLRFKADVEDMGGASADLMRLRPVTFRYKPDHDDGSNLLQYGLVAEEVAQVYPGLVQFDREGQPLAVRYHFLSTMLLNETQKLHRGFAELQGQVAAQQAQIEEQRAQIEELQRLLRASLAGKPPAAER